ncbi:MULTISPECIES: hypothetical protein [unclassified Paraflavitalea]|uniref:hypothetical protein n=1 Tax=unclassified Paraflavitalea TaxID=2798305 RepID=UPI003D33445F
MIGHEKALEECLKLDRNRINFVFFELLKKNRVDFAELSKVYVRYLEHEKREKEMSISKMALYVAFLSSDKDSEMAKEARKHLYDSGHWGKEGIDSSAFGKKLDDEFGGQ